MDVAQIRVIGNDEFAKYNELTSWLKGNRDFRGRVTRVAEPTAAGRLGNMVEMIAVVLGSEGAGVVLAKSLGG